MLRSDGFALDVIHAKYQRIPDGDYSMGVVLGAPESANDDLSYLRNEMDLIRRFVADGTPLLGICLGSQLIARAFGGRVYRGKRAEIGFFGDLYPEGGGLLSGLANPFTAFHWHGDTFDLPPGAVRLARSSLYENQALRVGSAVGLQFHLEVDAAMIARWLDASGEWLAGVPEADPDAIRQQADPMAGTLSGNMLTFYRRFKSEFGL